MISGTYSPSLDLVHQGFDRKVQQSALSESTNDWGERPEKIDLIASQFALMGNILWAMNFLPLSIGTLSNAMTLPMGAVSNAMMGTANNAITSPLRTASNAVVFPAETIGSIVALSILAASNPRVGTHVDVPISESPQVEHRGWSDFIESAEYEARLAAISPGSANNEAEEHVPPPPRGKVRAIRLR